MTDPVRRIIQRGLNLITKALERLTGEDPVGEVLELLITQGGVRSR